MFKVRSRKAKPNVAGSTNPEVCRAVSERRLARCSYDHSEERLIEPHCHGHGRDGNEVLSAYQVSGPTELGWKMFDVSKLTDFVVSTERFPVRHDFNPEHPGMSQVHCRVKPRTVP